MKVSFYLKNRAEVKSSLLFNISYAGTQFRLSTKIVIPTSNWNQKRQQIIKHQHRLELNNKLKYYQAEIEKYCLREEPSVKNLKDYVVFLRDGEQNKVSYLVDYLDNFIKVKSNEWSKLTPKKYITLRNHIVKFQKFKNKIFTFDDINESFESDFKYFLNNYQNLRNSTRDKNLKFFKTFLNYALDAELTYNTKIIKLFKTSSEDSFLIALNDYELNAIVNQEYYLNYLDKSRDLFVFQCYTGLRFSDMINLKPSNFDLNNKLIIINQIKTHDIVNIPLHPEIEKILVKYNYQIPKISNQKYNNYIKEVCKIAGIDTPTQIVYYKGKKRIEEIKPKYELVSSHTARRTFITISLKRGVLPEIVMKVSGHKDRKSFQKYVRIAKEEAVEEIRNAWK